MRQTLLIPPPARHRHRCKHPVVHTLTVLAAVIGWLTWSIWALPHVAPWILTWTDPTRINPWSLLIVGLAPLGWIVVIPTVAFFLWLVGRDQCGRTAREVRAILTESFDPCTSWRPGVPPPAGEIPRQPVMIERVLLSPEDAARRGLPGPVIVERIHYS